MQSISIGNIYLISSYLLHRQISFFITLSFSISVPPYLADFSENSTNMLRKQMQIILLSQAIPNLHGLSLYNGKHLSQLIPPVFF